MTYLTSQTSDYALHLSQRAQLPAVSAWAVKVAYTVVQWDDRYKARQKLRTMPPERLADMGISPAQARAEANKRFWRQ